MREIRFEIPGEPSVIVEATEVGDGTIRFDLVVAGVLQGDLRGLFFNFGHDTTSLVISGDYVTDQAYGAVDDLGHGANMKGGGREGYDVGVEFGTQGIGKDDISAASFTLASTDGTALTLDMIAHMEFGARLTSVGSGNARNGSSKIAVVAPAAPDANDDTATTLEDTAVTIDAVGNDTDGDGQALTITAVDNPLHGTASIVGNQIVYQADAHWSGTENFTYAIGDGDGGSDIATIEVTVEAVADAPELELAIRAGVTVQQVVVDITSSLVDSDGSESCALKVSGLPAGVTLLGAPGGMIANPTGFDTITLVLAEGMDFDFDLTVEAISTESSNGDTATTTKTTGIVFEYNEVAQTVSFQANDQSQWGSGTEFTFDDERFLGLDTADSGSGGGFINYSYNYDMKVGFNSDLHFGGGQIDADIPWNLDFKTFYNETTDVLVIDTAAALATGGSFVTAGPELTYDLDFLFDVYLNARVGLYIDLEVTSINETLFNPTVDIDETLALIDFDSTTSPSFTLDFPYGLSGTLEWPNLEVAGTEGVAGFYSGSGSSNNFITVNLDADQLAADILLGGVNPFDLSVDLGVAGGSLELVDVDVFAGLNFLQNFSLQAGSLSTTMIFEDGSSQAFSFGDELIFADASGLDANNDGNIDFMIDMSLLNSSVTNDTDLGFNVGYNFDLLKGGWWYDVAVASDSGSFGPFVDLGGSVPVASVDVYSNTFDLAFEDKGYLLTA